MPTFSLVIPDAIAQDVLDAVMENNPKPPEFQGTNTAWVKQVLKGVLIQFMKQGRKKFRLRQGQETFQGEESTYNNSFDIP